MNNRSALTASLIGLNLVMSKLAATWALPVYLDTVGTILAAALLPPWAAVVVGVSTSLLAGVIVHPAFFYYLGTQASVALAAYALCRAGAFSRWPTAALSGLALGGAAAIVSAPVTVLVFGGVTLGSTTAVNSIFMAAGQGIWKSVLGGSLIIESLDKVAGALLACEVLRRLPKSLLSSLRPESK